MCDNKSALGIATDTMKARRSKAIDMRYHWVRDRIRSSELEVQWCKTFSPNHFLCIDTKKSRPCWCAILLIQPMDRCPSVRTAAEPIGQHAETLHCQRCIVDVLTCMPLASR